MRHGPVTFDSKSFRIGPNRVWLHAGEIHYFRHPHELWRETLLRAKAAGLNTISTYIAWNFHEETEGQTNFTGDRDLGRFLDLCAELDLYVVARPGPYICTEWDGGGLPAWLKCQRTRDNDPVFIAAMRRWFERLLPIIAERQVSRGGPVILVQNENEFHGGWNESTREYIRTINTLFRDAGIDVPIIACNAHGYTPTTVMINYSLDPADQIIWPDMILSYNWGPGADPLRDLRQKQPHAPLFMTEYWAGPQVFWGKPISDWCATPEYARSMIEFASLGCQVTYYMFDGGTNFGYWAGSNIVTSYQSNYPVRDGGVLGEKYYRLKPVNHFITQFGDCLADSEEVPADVTAPAGTRLILRQCPAGRLLFVSDAGKVTSLRLSNGLDVAMPFLRALVLPVDLEVLPGVRLSSNLGLLGRTVLWGVAGTTGEVTVNGQRKTLMIPAERAAKLVFGKTKVFVVSEELAGRTWFLDDGRVVFGGDLVVSTGIQYSAAGRIQCVSAKGTVKEVAVPPVSPRPALPALGEWHLRTCAETSGGGTDWQALPDGPRTHDALGRLFGYVWYRAEYEAPADAVLPLCAPLLTTRLSVYANGVYCGTTGELTRFVEFCGYRHPADALQQDQVLVPVRKGNNTLVFLSDHLGRSFVGPLDPQGLQGPVYLGARRVGLGTAKPFEPAPLSDEAFQAIYHKEFRQPRPLPGVEFVATIPAETDAYLVLPAGLKNIAVSVEGRHVAGLTAAAVPFSAVRLPTGGKLRLQCQVPAREGVYLILAPRRQMPVNWSWQPGGDWPSEVTGAAVATAGVAAWGGIVPDRQEMAGGGVACPTYFTTTFPMPAGESPVFLNIGRLHKGQLFLNGHNLGRFWQVGGHWQGNGAQHLYYLPRPWMHATNTLVVFDEHGLRPNGVALTWGGDASTSVAIP